MDARWARVLWQVGEPLHAVTYFAPEVQERTDALGLEGFWMGYFGCRAAPLGPAPAAVVTATFYNFHPAMVARAIPDAWQRSSPAALLDARLATVDAALRRLLGSTVDGGEVRTAARLATVAAGAAQTAGRPLAAANAAQPVPDEPHLALWRALTVLREHRGDGHVAALVGLDVGPCAAHVLVSASGGPSPQLLQRARRWSPEEWAATEDDLRARGWLDASGALTAAGRAVKAEVEQRTDALAVQPWTALRDDEVRELVAALRVLSERVVGIDGGVPVPNPMGLPWPPQPLPD